MGVRGPTADRLAGLPQSIDAANARAHGGATLLAQFKDAFSEPNSSYTASGQQPAQALARSALNSKDVSVLSGLAYFQASMSGTSENGSAAHWISEAGQVDHQASQSTDISGVAKSTGLSVAQTQAATLVASFERTRAGEMLDTPRNGNYDVHRINAIKLDVTF